MKLASALTLGLLLSSSAFADVKKREPTPKSKGAVYQWQSEDELVYHYRVPKNYDHEKGANLTFILHGSNLDHRWGFANHSAKTFRTDDIVISPDGTTPNGRGGFNFLGDKKNASRLHSLYRELKRVFNVSATYLYGHSQGSFFAFYYAGEYPSDVNGMVGHASGVWNWTKQSRKGHDQAIVLMHGNQDPVVPYGQSVGGFHSFKKAKYPLVRLRTLEGWNHWPAEHNGPVPHTSQQLAWCEGMTTDNADRLSASFETLADVKNKQRHDYAGLYLLSQRIVDHGNAPGALKKKAARAMSVVEKLAESHVEAIAIPEKLTEPGAWSGHLALFLRAFAGVPACDDLAEDLNKILESHKKTAITQLKSYYAAKKKGDKAKAFASGVSAIQKGFLYHECEGRNLLSQLKEWNDDAKKLKLPKKAMQAFGSVRKFTSTLSDGAEAFDKINKKNGKL